VREQLRVVAAGVGQGTNNVVEVFPMRMPLGQDAVLACLHCRGDRRRHLQDSRRTTIPEEVADDIALDRMLSMSQTSPRHMRSGRLDGGPGYRGRKALEARRASKGAENPLLARRANDHTMPVPFLLPVA
jgi:hypothetical protein